MTSALSTLRNMPASQADVYNGYLPKSTKVRQDVYLSGEAKVAQIGQLADTAKSSLQSLQQSTNSAEQSIRNAAGTTNADASESNTLLIRRLLDAGMNTQDVCRGLIEDNNRDGFRALYAELKWQDRLSKLTMRLDKMQELVLGFEKQLMSSSELSALVELRECDAFIGWLRDNFAKLDAFFAMQLQPSVVQGRFQRLEKLAGWPGLPDSNYNAPYAVSLVDDVGTMAPRETARNR